jgi:hypothetical protein
MPRKSSIAALPDHLLEALERAIQQGRATVDDLVTLVNGAGHMVSRSAMGRHRKVSVERLAKFRETQEIAGEWVRQLRADPDGDIGRMLGEMLKLLAFRTQMDMQEGEGNIEPLELSRLARTLRDLGSLDKLKVEAEARVGARIKGQAAEAAAGAAREAGLSEERVAQIRREVLGIGRPKDAA